MNTYIQFLRRLRMVLEENIEFDHQKEDIETILRMVELTKVKMLFDDYDYLKTRQLVYDNPPPKTEDAACKCTKQQPRGPKIRSSNHARIPNDL